MTELGRQEFQTYLPSCIDPRTRQVVWMFPGYAFVRFDAGRDPWGVIRSTRGVGGLICHAAGQPTPLPIGIIEGLIARTSDFGVVEEPASDPAAPISRGTLLRLPAGSMGRDELTGVCDWTSAKRVRMLIMILGREVPVTVDRTAVEAV